MSTGSAPHTLFELLLLLIGLRTYGVESSSFPKISKDLIQNDVVQEDPTYDPARLESDALKRQYLHILKNEVRAKSQQAAQQAKRKRSPTPTLNNLEEAGKHNDLLEGLSQKYFARHREEIIKEILEDEKTYDRLNEELKTLKIAPHDGVQEGLNAESKDGIKTLNSTQGTSSVASPATVGANGAIGNSLKPLVSNEYTKGAISTSRTPHTTGRLMSGHLPIQVTTSNTSKVLMSNPSTPAAQFNPSIPSKPGSTAQSTASPNIQSYFSSRDKLQQQRPGQPTPSTTQILPPPSYATPGNYPASARSTGTPSQQGPFFGTIQFTPASQPSNRGPTSVTRSPLPSKIFGQSTPSGIYTERRRVQGLQDLDAPRSSTKWKDSPRYSARDGKTPPPPSNSPYMSESPSPIRKSHDTGHRSSAEPSRAQDTPTRGRGRGRWQTRGRGRGGRPSAASPGARTRGHSAFSGAEDSAAEGIGRKFKTEAPSTPGFPDENTSFVSMPGDSKPGPKRRELLRDGETPKPNLKRKRADTSDGTPEVHAAPKFSRPGQVLASRNFPRIVSALLNDINSHKLASVFAKPLTEKSAPGYLSLIYRPQDLKSIRSAISAGSRFVATIPDPEAGQEDTGGDTPAAAATPSTTITKATNIWVDRTPEVISPKGIVNSAQLEKELCRMLANAVMYNPDPKRGFGPHFRLTQPNRERDDSDDEMETEDDLDDGRLVNDAREMFASVEQAVAAWRSAERINPGDTSSKAGNGDKGEETGEDAAENTGAEDGDGEKSSLRRSARG